MADIIRDHRLHRINLLKVDAEKCELEILRGVSDDDWPRIDQVVIEVHDRTRRMVDEVLEILGRHGFQCAVEEENLLTGSGLFNVYATRSDGVGPAGLKPKAADATAAEVREKADQFVQALDAFTRTAAADTVVCVCPSPAQVDSAGNDLARHLSGIEANLLDRLRGIPQVRAIGSDAITTLYPVADFHDPHANQQGHVPYTPEGFAALGSILFRNFAALRRPPYKVIALDCDNTLWQGTCGEDGPLGVTVTPAHRALQEFMIRQAAAGMLLCLNSKNDEADVWAVFDQNPGMLLKREHLASARINWASKSGNLRSLAVELNLGLESIIFVDDNPVECAEVRANCPSVVTLQLPEDSANLAPFLAHAWAFDHLRVTEEDRTRTKKMRENLQRESFRGQAPTLKEFIDGLQLQVDIFEPGPDQIGRVAQLTQRTNQFNFTTVRRNESEILHYLGQEKGHCLGVKVRDRFGDYGMVGLLLYGNQAEGCAVDTFLLSCRVLGRGVEHQMLAELGRRAGKDGKPWVELLFRPTPKNQPAGDFIKLIGGESLHPREDGLGCRLPSATLAALRYDPDCSAAPAAVSGEESGADGRPKSGGAASAGLDGLREKYQRIASELGSVPRIAAAIEAARLRASGYDAKTAENELPDTLEGRLLGIWRKILGNSRIGVNDNFFEAGGTSLRAVQTVAAIRRDLQLHLSIVNIFECPTVHLLARKLEPGKVEDASADDARERGARRKNRVRKRS